MRMSIIVQLLGSADEKKVNFYAINSKVVFSSFWISLADDCSLRNFNL